LAIGFTLNDLAAALSERDRGGTPCHSVRTLVAERLAEVETHLRDLTELRDELRILLREWDRRLARIPAGAQACLLDVLADRPVVDRAVARQRRIVAAANPRRGPVGHGEPGTATAARACLENVRHRVALRSHRFALT
jgi:hypothetical protein